MADSPEQLARLLAELEARKAALKQRLSSLDAAIIGIQAITEPSPDDLGFNTNKVDVLVEDPGSLPVREAASSSMPLPVEHEATPASPAQQSRSLVEKETPLRRPVHAPAPERRKPGKLNIYVNQNTEWAARQLAPAHSTRSILRRRTGHRCPSCGSQDTRISLTRGISDLFMFLFDYSTARCRNCDTRFRIWQNRSEEEEAQALSSQPSSVK